jgi:hypothetical protein
MAHCLPRLSSICVNFDKEISFGYILGDRKVTLAAFLAIENNNLATFGQFFSQILIWSP